MMHGQACLLQRRASCLKEAGLGLLPCCPTTPHCTQVSLSVLSLTATLLCVAYGTTLQLLTAKPPPHPAHAVLRSWAGIIGTSALALRCNPIDATRSGALAAASTSTA